MIEKTKIKLTDQLVHPVVLSSQRLQISKSHQINAVLEDSKSGNESEVDEASSDSKKKKKNSNKKKDSKKKKKKKSNKRRKETDKQREARLKKEAEKKALQEKKKEEKEKEKQEKKEQMDKVRDAKKVRIQVTYFNLVKSWLIELSTGPQLTDCQDSWNFGERKESKQTDSRLFKLYGPRGERLIYISK